jgi:large subunit ribosomal protein L24
MKIKKNCHVKKGDTIQIISGSNKGFVGKILTILHAKSIVFIEGIAPRVKYFKRAQNTEAKMVELPIPIHISNVMLWDNKANLSSRVGYDTTKEGQKSRYFKKSGNLVERSSE